MIAEFIAENRTAPTFAELRAKLGISSNQTLLDRLDALVRKGFLTKTEGKHRSILLGPRAAEYILMRNRASPMVNLVGYVGGTGVVSNQLQNASLGEDGTGTANPINPQNINNTNP